MIDRVPETAELRHFAEMEARGLGFDAFGVVKPEAIGTSGLRLREFIAAGHHGSMQWMAETLVRRSHPQALWPDVRTIIVLGMNYGPETNPLEILDQSDRGAISVYARHRDYHDVIKGKLKTLASKIAAQMRTLNVQHSAKVFVDTAPVMEKPLAAAAGLGWQGKHTNLVSRDFGSWLFLGSIFTTLDLPPDVAEIDHCGSCSSCLDVCPTRAFPAPYQLDARRCISYLTIENKGPIPIEFRKPMGNRIFGCDDCLAVCPWNKFATSASEAKLATRGSEKQPLLSEFLGLDDAGFRARFSGSPVKRIGRDRFMRNCLIAAGNSNDLTLVPAVEKLLNDSNPIVVEAAGWALGELRDAGA